MTRFAIGSYTSPQGHVPDARGQGMSIVRLDEHQQLHIDSVTDTLQNPTYLCWSNTEQKLFAACEAGDHPGQIDVFCVTDESVPVPLQTCLADGKDACHISFDSLSSSLYTASYGGGQLALFDEALGQLEFNSAFVYAGNGPDAARQEAPHAHQVTVSPHSRDLYVCDLGSDTIWKHPLPSRPQAYANWHCDAALTLPAGAGPRHLVFHPKLPVAYVLCELKPIIAVTKKEVTDGTLEIVQEISCIAPDAELGTVAPAAIKLHPNEKTLVVSNRFRDTVSVFELSANGQQLTFSGEYACGGKTPRDIEFNVDGSLLLIANQDSHNLSSLRFDAETGLCLGEPGPELECGSPVCVVRLD